MSTIITIAIDGDDLRLRCNAHTGSSERERKYAAMVMAALDTVIGSMETGQPEELVAAIIRPTINKRLVEAGVSV